MNRFTSFLKIFKFAVILLLVFFSVDFVFASATNGTIDSSYKYGWGENVGWINFGCDNCNVQINDSSFSGYAWSSQYGWINLSPSNSGVKNTAEGDLSGYAWGSNIGWINFSNVSIDTSGYFLGYATVESDSSRINLNCINANSCASSNFKIRTDWRPASARHTNSGGSKIIFPITLPIIPAVVETPFENIKEVADSPFLDFFADLFKKKKTEIAEVSKTAPLAFRTRWNLLPVRAINSFVFAPLPYEIRALAAKFPELNQTLKSVGIQRMSDMQKLSGTTFSIQGLKELEKTLKMVGVGKLGDINKLSGVALNVPIMSNLELEKNLQALGVEKMSDLDKLNNSDLKKLGMSNYELKKLLEDLGVKKVGDISKLENVALTIPGFSDLDQKIIGNIGSQKISLIGGLPVAKFPNIAKQNLASEFVFARTSGELIDLNVAISIGNKGEVSQKISSLPGKTLKLVVKPVSKARSVTGYFVFKSATPKISKIEFLRSTLTASVLLSLNNDSLVEKNPEPVSVENKLVLSSFEYEDPDHDGIYTADVMTPSVPGEYEVITVIDYIDPTLGVRQMRMITVIDPEGYVFEKSDGKETRIPSAIVSLYYLNTSTKKYELWPAENYQQENPQTTDVRGTYSFLVPEGSYYFEVEAPGYDHYEGKVFVVKEGSGVHQNIELKSGRDFFSSNIDWKTILLVVVLILLVYNLFKDKLSRFHKKNE